MYSAAIWAPRVILIFAATSGEASAIHFHERYAGAINFYFEHLFFLEGAFKLIVAIGICLVLLRNYRLLEGMPDQRRRVRWVLAAAGAGIALPAIFVLIGITRHSANPPRTGTYPINIVITNLVAAIIPLTLAYALIKHRVLGISVVLRRSLQYLLTKQSLRLFLLLPLVLLASGIVAGAVMSDMGADPQLRSSFRADSRRLLSTRDIAFPENAAMELRELHAEGWELEIRITEGLYTYINGFNNEKCLSRAGTAASAAER